MKILNKHTRQPWVRICEARLCYAGMDWALFGLFGADLCHNTKAVRHHFLAQINLNKLVSLG